MLTEYGNRIDELTAGNQAATIAYAATLQGVENYEKKIAGQMAGADAISLVEKKQAEESGFRAWIKADPKREAQYGAALAEYDRMITEGNAAALADQRKGMLARGQLYAAARQLYRWANEQAKPNKDREPGYQDRDRAFMTQGMQRIERRYVAEIDKAFQALASKSRSNPELHAAHDLATTAGNGDNDAMMGHETFFRGFTKLQAGNVGSVDYSKFRKSAQR
jgi:hypothetical protein